MRERRLRAHRLGRLLLAGVVLFVVAALAGYALGAVHRPAPLRPVTLPAQQVDIGQLDGSVSIRGLCTTTCPPAR